MTWLRDAVGAAALLAVVMTLADVIWAPLDLPHLRTYAVAHGAIAPRFAAAPRSRGSHRFARSFGSA